MNLKSMRKIRTSEAKNRYILNNAQPGLKKCGSYKNKAQQANDGSLGILSTLSTFRTFSTFSNVKFGLPR